MTSGIRIRVLGGPPDVKVHVFLSLVINHLEWENKDNDTLLDLVKIMLISDAECLLHAKLL